MSLPTSSTGPITARDRKVTLGCPSILVGPQPADSYGGPRLIFIVPSASGPVILDVLTVLVGGTPFVSADTDICIGPPNLGKSSVWIAISGGTVGLSGALLGSALAGLKTSA